MAEKMDAALDYKNQKVETVVDTTRKIRVGIIGTGWIAEAHMDSYSRMPDVEVVAGADIIPGKAAAFFKRFGIENAKTDYASHKEMLDDESLQLDAVSICTYNRQIGRASCRERVCQLVTGVQTCALPISLRHRERQDRLRLPQGDAG